jgi:membrane-bound serine protease (ClpP class)
LLLMALAIVLFVLEAKLTSHGVLLIGGIVSMLLGATFLIRSPLTPGGVSLGVALAATVPFALLSVFLMRLVLKSRKWKSSTGREELLGEHGVVTTAVPAGGEGMIRIHGELWRATSTSDLQPGTTVKILRVAGLKLAIEAATVSATDGK